MNRIDDELKEIERCGMRMMILAVVLAIVTTFFFFCTVEAVVLLFVPGSFSLALPVVATVLLAFAYIALAMVGGGDR